MIRLCLGFSVMVIAIAVISGSVRTVGHHGPGGYAHIKPDVLKSLR